jgi:hypothetical protein
MKSRIQVGNVGRVPAPAEKRFPINNLSWRIASGLTRPSRDNLPAELQQSRYRRVKPLLVDSRALPENAFNAPGLADSAPRSLFHLEPAIFALKVRLWTHSLRTSSEFNGQLWVM